MFNLISKKKCIEVLEDEISLHEAVLKDAIELGMKDLENQTKYVLFEIELIKNKLIHI